MPYYEFRLYAPSRQALQDVRQTLTGVVQFDPTSAHIRPTCHTVPERVAWAVRRAFGRRRRNDWLLTITGPEIHREYAYRLIDHYEGYCDGGGYDLMYDPTGFYTDDQIVHHTVQWRRRMREANESFFATLPEHERLRVLRAQQELSTERYEPEE